MVVLVSEDVYELVLTEFAFCGSDLTTGFTFFSTFSFEVSFSAFSSPSDFFPPKNFPMKGILESSPVTAFLILLVIPWEKFLQKIWDKKDY